LFKEAHIAGWRGGLAEAKGVGMKLVDIIDASSVIPELKSTTRNGVIRELVQSLADHGAVDPEAAETAAKAAIRRENTGTTGIGKGVAVPHAKHKCIKKITATIGRSSRGVDFAALDRAPVYSVVLLLSPEKAHDDHLAAMEKIFRQLQREQFRKWLRQADTSEKILDLIRETDEF
jgi:mannitol/fructose-specific phosphotransferase system IIA component (Ntr-type)